MRNIDAHYGSLTACRQISLSVAPGEVLALIGPNGAGKTSFVGALAGIVSGRGSIHLDSIRLDAKAAHNRTRSGLATVPDNRGLFAPLTVEKNIQLAAQLVAKPHRADAINSAVARFPFLRQRWHTLAGSLSGGEQQMLSIAKSLAGNPRALVLDEPSQGLAPIILDELVKVFSELKAGGLPILLVEQNHGLVERIADRFVAMVGGRLVLEGSVAELHDRDRIARLFLQQKHA